MVLRRRRLEGMCQRQHISTLRLLIGLAIAASVNGLPHPFCACILEAVAQSKQIL